MRDAVEEIGGAVERVDDPAMVRVGALGLAAFLEQQPVARPGALQLGLQRALGAQIGGRDKIAGPLDRDLQLLDLAEIALEPRAALSAALAMTLMTGEVAPATVVPAAQGPPSPFAR